MENSLLLSRIIQPETAQILISILIIIGYCSTLGSPPPNLTWYKGHELIDDQDQTKNGRTINILTLAEPVQKKDAGAIYTCQAVNNNQSIPVATKLKLEIACK